LEEVKIVRKHESKKFMEGDEICNLYFETNRVYFGVSTIPANMKGDVDPGHSDAYEVFYVVEGTVLCYIPNDRVYKELNKGDAILIPPQKAHQLINKGENTAIIIWAQSKS
jgi:mannose-6-phosphate isomerase-like protein (cupin superfamily)